MGKDFVVPIEMQIVDSGDIDGAHWEPIGVPIEGACFLLRISNDTTKSIFISYDGVTDHDFLHSYTDMTINLQTNSSPANMVSKLKKGLIISFSGDAGTGNVYVSGFYNG